MTWWGKREIGPLMTQWNINLGAFWWRNGQIRDPSNDESGVPWWPDREILGPRPLILFKRFNMAPFPNLWAPNFNWEILDVMQVKKEYTWALILHCSAYISKIVWGCRASLNHSLFVIVWSFWERRKKKGIKRLCEDYRCLILIFSVIYLDSRGYIGWGPRLWRYLKSFVLFFSSLPFPFPFLFFLIFHFLSLFVCLSRGPFNSGAPGHRPPMPPSRYATGWVTFQLRN